ncbi:MAG: hypothetical protein IPH88_10755 [Bacteroidales bacterium]|nr:hypothetical protein [Bacteroidales bacterium]
MNTWKTQLGYLIITLLGFSLSTSVFSQAVAIGHISAEVVEAVSASSFASTDLSISNSESENISLGRIELSSGKDVSCNLTIKPATLTDNLGNDFSIEPMANQSGSNLLCSESGTRTIELEGKATLAANQASGLYQGSYTLVFAYN